MKKPMVVMLISVTIVFGSIFAYKTFVSHMTKKFFASLTKIVSVSTMRVTYTQWQSKLTAVGSLRAIRGVNVTTELAAMVQKIYFMPGAYVKEGTVLVQLNADADIATLHSLQANAALARITYNRDKIQYSFGAISKAVLDNDIGNLKSLNAQVAEQTATVIKKTIRAPFTGRLGISAVNPGQYINTGDMIVTLQTLDPIYIDFYLPQQTLSNLKVSLPVTVTSDAFLNQTFIGKITTINPLVDTGTRNVEVEATIRNPRLQLLPGMFASVAITTGKPNRYLTLPQTAISFNPYGDAVFLVRKKGTDKDGKPILIVNQAFVITGETRGEQIAILKGLKEGDVVVTSGQLKLKNGDRIAINNSVIQPNEPVTAPPNEH